MEKWYIDYENMTEEEYAKVMAQAPFRPTELEIMRFFVSEFWTKFFMVMWMLAVAWMVYLIVCGRSDVVSTNAFWSNIVSVILVPIIIVIRYHDYRKEW